MVETTFVVFGCVALDGVAWDGVCGFATIPIEGCEKFLLFLGIDQDKEVGCLDGPLSSSSRLLSSMGDEELLNGS